MTEVGFLIKTKRRAKGLSQNQLGKMCGYCNGQYISNAERGKCGISIKLAKQLIAILSIKKLDMRIAMSQDHWKWLKREIK